jgi:hypothetical protein
VCEREEMEREERQRKIGARKQRRFINRGDKESRTRG